MRLAENLTALQKPYIHEFNLRPISEQSDCLRRPGKVRSTFLSTRVRSPQLSLASESRCFFKAEKVAFFQLLVATL